MGRKLRLLKKICPSYFEYYQKMLDKKGEPPLSEPATGDEEGEPDEVSDNVDYTKEEMEVFKGRLNSCIDTVNRSLGMAKKDTRKFSYEGKNRSGESLKGLSSGIVPKAEYG